MDRPSKSAFSVSFSHMYHPDFKDLGGYKYFVYITIPILFVMVMIKDPFLPYILIYGFVVFTTMA